jgi:uncharacterized membrane protein
MSVGRNRNVSSLHWHQWTFGELTELQAELAVLSAITWPELPSVDYILQQLSIELVTIGIFNISIKFLPYLIFIFIFDIYSILTIFTAGPEDPTIQP